MDNTDYTRGGVNDTPANNGARNMDNTDYTRGGVNDTPADNDDNGQCMHCGRDNKGYEGTPCSDDCPKYWEIRGFTHPDARFKA